MTSAARFGFVPADKDPAVAIQLNQCVDQTTCRNLFMQQQFLADVTANYGR
jgi:hypothetical protein